MTKNTEGVLLLCNPTDVPARWTVAHVPSNETTKRVSEILVEGYNERGPETDDPMVFEFSPTVGTVQGPTVSPESAVGAPPKDFNRTYVYYLPLYLLISRDFFFSFFFKSHTVYNIFPPMYYLSLSLISAFDLHLTSCEQFRFTSSASYTIYYTQ